MLTKKIAGLLKEREFISIATCDLAGRPNAAPKFILKIQDNSIYLIDHTVGRTWSNLKVNPRASLSFMDTDSLLGYQINGAVEIIDKGQEYEKVYAELLQRKIGLSAERIIEGVGRQRKHSSFEVALTDKFTIIKVNIEETVELGLGGEVKREKL